MCLGGTRSGSRPANEVDAYVREPLSIDYTLKREVTQF